MCFVRGMKVRVNAEVQLYVVRFEPYAAARGKFRRFGDFDESQYIDVKVARFSLFADGHGELNMVDGKNGHGCSLWFDGVSRFGPRVESAEESGGAGISILQE